MDSSKALIRCEQEENVDCRLPTGSSYLERPPDVRVLLQVCLLAGTVLRKRGTREYGCCTEPTPSGVALIATPNGPLASDPSCTVITVPKTRATTAIAKGGGVVGGRDV